MVSPFCATSKDYSKKAYQATHKTRHRFMQREKAAIIKLRKLGYSINQLKDFFGRSTSVIHNILNKSFGPKLQLRKLPNQVRLKAAQIKRQTMNFRITQWLPFILGDTSEPP